MKLINVQIHKYKSIETDQSFRTEDGITVLVGMNEAGKTSVLEAISKVNYFTQDEGFKFNTTHDYPRKEKKKLDKSGEDPRAVTLTFEISNELANIINEDLGKGIFTVKTFSYSKRYSGKGLFTGITASLSNFIELKLENLNVEDESLPDQLKNCGNATEFKAVLESIEDDDVKEKIQALKPYFENSWKWDTGSLSEYVARVHITPNMPKFLYYDEYYTLPSEVAIEELVSANNDTEEGEHKTAKALFELADIDIEELLNADDFEDYVAELEATQALISKELFKYWSANKNLKIRFAIDKRIEKSKNAYNREDRIVQHRLSIRVENTRSDMTLPLRNRSKGFNWFFSFLVWFKKIQEDANSNYILLLDEPGLNLHATAQGDLLRFFEDLAEEYQIIYTTHSPFMIDSAKLGSVRTVVETEEVGTRISDTIQEKDPKTLFPLQAALGYNVAQNLFISKNNLLVEGVSDLIYLTVVSDLLKANGKNGLRDDTTIVPVGGLDKVTTFISLLGANKLKLVCLLDSFVDQKGKARLENLIKGGIIKQKNIKFFDEYVSAERADIEDLFEKSEYLTLFNEAFSGEHQVNESDLDSTTPTILGQIGKVIGKAHFNHYRPAKFLAAKGVNSSFFSENTFNRFEAVFKDINKLL